MAVDLYAPRLLEAPFEGTLTVEAVATLRAVAAGDTFLVSNARQRWAWLGVLALAGIDVREDPTRLVPLVAPRGGRRRIPQTPVLVAGGASWPWQDPTPALCRVLEHLDRRDQGRVVWFGGPPLIGENGDTWSLPRHPRLETPGWVPRDDLLRRYCTSTVAIDWMSFNPERSLAFSFRHADYLGCGLPILTGPDTALADILGGAGWVGNDVEGLIDGVLDDPGEVRSRSRTARNLARQELSLEHCEAPLLHWIENPTSARQSSGPLLDAADLAARLARETAVREATEDRLTRAMNEVADKREEVTALNTQLRSLTSVVDRLSRAVDEVAGFKREAITVLGNRSDQSLVEARDLQQELATLRADLAKKNAELGSSQRLADRLENDLVGAHAEIERLRNRGLLRRS
jgi:hypothetical protein